MLEASITSRIEALKHVFLAPGSTFSLASLFSAMVVCALFFVWRRRARGRPVRLRAFVRYVLPLRIFLHPSSRADAILFVLQTMVFGALLGWAYLSQPWIAGRVVEAMTFVFGEPGSAPVHPVVAAIIITLMSFLAYEFGYWLFHWAAHTHPLLWEFHKIHHTAEVLTPLTVWRVHPVEQVIFINTLAITIGLCDGLGRYVLGGGAQVYAVSGANIVLVFFVYAFVHLQHSQAWIAFTGVWGRLFLSPAHHQIHHSAKPHSSQHQPRLLPRRVGLGVRHALRARARARGGEIRTGRRRAQRSRRGRRAVRAGLSNAGLRHAKSRQGHG